MQRRTFIVGLSVLIPKHFKANPAYVIAAPCIDVKDTACVDVCPVDCIHPTKKEAKFKTARQLFIDPAECIDCGACVPVCPKEAIFPLDKLPANWKEYSELNARYYGRSPKEPQKKAAPKQPARKKESK